MSAQPPSPAWPPPGAPGVPGVPPGPYPPRPTPPQPRAKPRYSRFAALVLSLFSPSLYRDVARNWRGIGVLYLLLLMALTWLPPIIRGHITLRNFVRDEAPAVIDQLPTLTIRDGVASIEEPEPYVVRDPETGRAMIYVDTTGEFSQEKDAREATFLLSRSKLEVRQPNKTEVHDLSKIEYLYIDKHVARRWLGSGATVFGPLAYVGALLWSLVWGMIRLLIYALIGLIFVSAFNARLDFAALMRLAAVAMTPGMLLDTLSWTFNFGWMPCCGWSMLIGMITLIYLGFAVKVNADVVPPGAYPPPYGLPGGPAQHPHPPPPPAAFPPPR
jgi:hypothetical protein